MFEQILEQLDLPPYRLKQINHAVFKELICDWEQATSLPADLREYLQANVPISTIEPVKILVSAKGDTIKVAFRAVGNDKLRITNYELNDDIVGAGLKPAQRVAEPPDEIPAQGGDDMRAIGGDIRMVGDDRVGAGDGVSIKNCKGLIHQTPDRPLADQTSNSADNIEPQFESVLMMHNDRNTVCVSSQIGCPVGCAFCATGKMGFIRNLNYREIVDQVLFFARLLKYGPDKMGLNNRTGLIYQTPSPRDAACGRRPRRGLDESSPYKIVTSKINNIVFMGMGEPMLNVDNVSQSIDILTDDNKFALGKRRITISTSGYIEPLREFLKKYPHIGLAISLHAPNQPLREKLMPTVAKTNHINDLIAVAREYSQKTKRRVSFEYILIEGVNDKLEHAHELADMLNDLDRTGLIYQTLPAASRSAPGGRGEGLINQAPTGSKNKFLFHINLIPYNPVANLKSNFKKPNTHRVNRFRDELKKLGAPVSIRVSMGDDIAAACGQLANN